MCCCLLMSRKAAQRCSELHLTACLPACALPCSALPTALPTALPRAGRVIGYLPPGGPHVRMDSHLYPDYLVPPNYDSLLGKLIVWGENREAAINRMKRALNVSSSRQQQQEQEQEQEPAAC